SQNMEIRPVIGESTNWIKTKYRRKLVLKVGRLQDSRLQSLEQMPSGGYLSRVSSILHFWIG
ncbi:hypothetical protein, partial [Pedobacter steynii]